MPEELARQLDGLCSIAESDLSRLKDQLDKIIAAKKKSSSESVNVTQPQQIVNTQKAIENLEKIYPELSKAIGRVKELWLEVQPLLGKQFSEQPGVGLGIGSNQSERHTDEKK